MREVVPDTRFQIAVLAKDAVSLDDLSILPRIEWLACRQAGEFELEFLSGGEVSASIDFNKALLELPNLIAIVVVAGPAEHEMLKQRWEAAFPAAELDIINIQAFDTNALAGAALAALADELGRQRRFGGRAAMDLAIYRREFERLQHSFSRLEAYVSQHAMHKPIVLFEFPPTALKSATDPRLSAGAAAISPGVQQITQILPVDSLGVSGFAINILVKPPPDKTFQVRLCAMESERSFGRWSIDTANLQIGWLHLALTRAIDEMAMSLIVVIDLAAGLLPATLALGPPHPYEEFRARLDGRPCESPLAMRVFGGLPGVRVSGVTAAYSETDSARPTVTFVPEEICCGVVQVLPPLARQPAKLVIFDPALGKITVHPHEGGTTIARIDLDVPENAWRLSAVVSLEHELANPTRFALLAAPLTRKGNDKIVENLDEDSAWFSGWFDLAALESTRISVFIPRTKDKALTLYLLTRQAPAASADFAWARFGRFEFNAAPKITARTVEPAWSRPGENRAKWSTNAGDPVSDELRKEWQGLHSDVDPV